MSANKPLHVLCAVEPNEESRDTLKIAADFAARTGGDVRLIHIVPPAWQPYADLNFTPVVEAQVALEQDLVDSARDHLTKLAGDLGVTCAEIIVHQGQPAHDIAEKSKALDDVLLVIGVHNRRGLRRLMGSTAHAVLNATECPILLTHASEDHGTSYDRVVVAIDTSSAMQDVLAHAEPFIEQAKEIKVVTVVPSLAATVGSLQGSAFSTAWPLSDMQAEMMEATRTTVTEAAAAAGIDAGAVEIIEGHPAHEVCAVAEAMPADLIIMGSGRRNVLDRILLGSTAHGVLNATPCDVYIAR